MSTLDRTMRSALKHAKAIKKQAEALALDLEDAGRFMLRRYAKQIAQLADFIMTEQTAWLTRDYGEAFPKSNKKRKPLGSGRV